MGVLSTDADYNAESRWLEQKVVIHFSGMTPLEVTKDNLLITTSILEESHSNNGASPFGGVTSNELTVELLNEDSIFSPTNVNSPYYGRMRRGVKIEVLIRPVAEEEYDWDPLGVFYVTDWNATVTGLVATVTANDKLYSIFTGEIPDFIIRRNISHYLFYQEIFASLGLSADIDDSMTEVLKYAYIQSKHNNKDLLTTLGIGALADCFCKHDGTIKVHHLLAEQELRATITDADQLIEAKIEQSLTSGYDGAEVIYNIPQENELANVLNMSELNIPTGKKVVKDIALSKTPLVRLGYAKLTGAPNARIIAIKAIPTKVECTLENLDKDIPSASLDIFGNTLANNQLTLGDIGDNLLRVNNIYIQNIEYAQKVYSHLKAYINNLLPILEITVRGNPRFELCDKLQVISDKYNLDYTGLIIKQTFDYDGGLSSTITLLNIDVLQEVS